MAYTQRLVDTELSDLLATVPFVLIEGPKAVGKTESAKRVAKTIVRLDIDESSRTLAKVAPEILMQGEAPMLIDEWQLVPELWANIKVEVDSRQLKGQFILTGSSIPVDDVTRDTGAGRVARLKMRPLSLYEIGVSNGAVSISALMAGAKPASKDPGLAMIQIAEYVCRGGWPGVQDLTLAQSQKFMKSYLGEIASRDVQRVSGRKFDKTNVMKVLKSLARNVGTKAAETTIASDAGSKSAPLSRRVVANYLDALERVMVIEDNPPWTPELRSRARVNGTPTRYFIDPALAIAALGASPQALLGGQIRLFGFLFENLVVRDLRVYMQSLGGEVKQYRDEDKLEIDIILEMPDNRWAAIEVKLGVNQVDEAAKGLLAFRQKIDTAASGEPIFMAVVTAVSAAYVREDGIYVIPVGTLCP